MTSNDKINKILEEVSLDESLKRKILKSHLSLIEELEGKIQTLESTNEKLQENMAKESEYSTKISADLAKAQLRLDNIDAREKAVRDNENVHDKSQYVASIETDRRLEIKEILMAIVRNPTINHSVSGTVPLSVEGSAGMTDASGYPVHPPISGYVAQGNVEVSNTTTQE